MHHSAIMKYVVEFVGTFLFATVILATGNFLAIGATLALCIFVGGPISGGMYNPAVTMAMLAYGKLSSADIVPYIISQILGALLAYEFVKRVISRR